MLAAELDGKLTGYDEALPVAKFVKDAQIHADLKALGYSKEVLKLRGEIAALTLELEYTRWLLCPSGLT